MPTYKVFYFSHAPEDVYAIIREEITPGFKLVTLCDDSDEERFEKIAGAGLDVFEKEPFRKDNPLAAMPNVVLTPHISAGTRDALKTKMRALFQNIQYSV
jgi:hypothetical protein